jgi:hypothetical protein
MAYATLRYHSQASYEYIEGGELRKTVKVNQK